MLNKLIQIFKKLLLSFFMLYGFNIIVPSAAIIPINIVTILLLTVFGLPALIFLIIIKVLVY